MVWAVSGDRDTGSCVCVFVWLCELRMVIITILVTVIAVFLLTVVIMAAVEEISQLHCYE